MKLWCIKLCKPIVTARTSCVHTKVHSLINLDRWIQCKHAQWLFKVGFFLNLYSFTVHTEHPIALGNMLHIFLSLHCRYCGSFWCQRSRIPIELTVFLLSLITSSFVSRRLYKSVIAIFDSIIIIMINDYEYYSIVSIRLSHCVRQDKNKVCHCVKTIQEPATEAHFSADLNHFFGLCSVSETWVAAYVLWVLCGGFLITIYTLVNWKLDFLKRKGNYASQSTLAFLCTNVCLCVCELVRLVRLT